METLTTCPICDNTEFIHFSLIKDHFLSKEDFKLSQCKSCGFVFTNPRPQANDLAKYYLSEDYFSHSKKKKGIITVLYEAVKKYSLGKKFHLINHHKKPGDILDIGCGTGEFLYYMKNKGWKTLGIEPAEKPRNFAIENYQLDIKPEEEIKQIVPKTFDLITMWHVLEHIPDLNQRIEQIYSILKDDGILIIAIPNYLSLDALYYKNFWAGFDVPRHLYHFSPATISKILSKHHFVITDTFPMKFDSFYVSLLSEKYKTGKQNYFTAFINGLKSNLHAKNYGGNYSSLIYMVKKRIG